MKAYNPTRRLKHNAFTLIELLVVVAVILVLAGISIKMLSVVTRKAGVSRTLYVLEQTKNALEAYYAVIGSYPATSEMKYDHCVGQSSSGFDASAQISATEHYGLSYYLGYDNSNARHASWQKFVMGANPPVINLVGSHTNSPITKAGFDSIVTTNQVQSIRDAWDHDLSYTPGVGGNGYTLKSSGPDGIAGNSDDLGVSNNE